MAIIIAVLAFLSIGAIAWVAVGGDGDRAAKRAKEIAAPRKKRRPPGHDRGSGRAKAQADQFRRAQRTERDAEEKAVNRCSRSRARLRKPALPSRCCISGWPLARLALRPSAHACISARRSIWPPCSALSASWACRAGVLGFLISSRQKKFGRQMADGIDVIVRGVKSRSAAEPVLAHSRNGIARAAEERIRQRLRRAADGRAARAEPAEAI